MFLYLWDLDLCNVGKQDNSVPSFLSILSHGVNAGLRNSFLSFWPSMLVADPETSTSALSTKIFSFVAQKYLHILDFVLPEEPGPDLLYKSFRYIAWWDWRMLLEKSLDVQRRMSISVCCGFLARNGIDSILHSFKGKINQRTKRLETILWSEKGFCPTDVIAWWVQRKSKLTHPKTTVNYSLSLWEGIALKKVAHTCAELCTSLFLPHE